jgi:hypothetical protein
VENVLRRHALPPAPERKHTTPWPVFIRTHLACWQEHGGPPVTQPKQKGFGSAVLEQVMAEYFETPPTIEFAATGVRYEVSGSLDGLTTEKGIEQAPVEWAKVQKAW